VKVKSDLKGDNADTETFDRLASAYGIPNAEEHSINATNTKNEQELTFTTLLQSWRNKQPI
jgi:hypothetical protein